MGGLGDKLDRFLGVRKHPLPRRVDARPDPDGPDPRHGSQPRRLGGTDVSQPYFEPERLVAAAELPQQGRIGGGDDYGVVSLPPYIQPPPGATLLYERRAVAVPGGQSAFILEYTVDPGSVVWWAYLGTDQHLNSFYEPWVDGTIYEPLAGAAQVGAILNPFRLPAAVKATKNLRFRAYNFNANAFTYEVLMMGWITEKGLLE